MNKIPAIIGLGKTGISLAKHLSKSNNNLFIYESSLNSKSLKELKDMDVDFVLNPEFSERAIDSISVIYPSPGISQDHEILKSAKDFNIPVQTDMDIYLNNSSSFKILITGTNGKTTTACMLEHILKEHLKDKSVEVMGNIGKPVLDFLDKKIDVAIIEISSFQIESCSKLNSDIGILLNIEEDHLDRHKSFNIYRSLKRRVLAESKINISYKEQQINDKKFYDFEDYFSEFDFSNNPALKNWPTHDISNLKAALLATALTIKYIEKNAVSDLNNFLSRSLERMVSFSKKAHRFEMIEDEDGVLHINDSKATNFSATVQSIESSSKLYQEGDIYLLCGGDFKSQNIDKVKATIFNDIKKCFIFGKDKKILEELLSDFTDCICCDNLDDAYFLAKQESIKGDIILLSPACASIDMFKDYQDRGNRFKELMKLD
mgnify:FL=1